MKYRSCAIPVITTTALVLCAAAMLIACSDASHGDTITVAIGGNPNSLDPHRTSATITKQINRSIYDTLVEPDFSPLLAESWSVSEDALTWTFRLKNGIKFHNGKKFSAEDVLTTIARIQNPATDSPSRSQFHLIKNAYATDARTVVIQLASPYSGLLALFADGQAAILPKDLIEQNHNFNRNPVGTGPYVFSKWVDNSSVTLIKNQEYNSAPMHDDAPARVMFLVMADASTVVQALQRGELDVASYIVEPELTQTRALKNVTVDRIPGSTVFVIAMNNRRAILNNRDARHAIARAIDSNAVLKDAYSAERRTHVFWPEGTPYSVGVDNYKTISGASPTRYAPDAARDFFTRYFNTHPGARKKNEETKGLFVITAPQTYTAHVRAAQLYQQMLKTVGVNTSIELVDWPTWISRVYTKGDFDLTVIGHTGKIYPDQRLESYGKGTSYVGWKDAEFVDLVNNARIATNKTLIASLYRRAFVHMAQAQPFVFVGSGTITIARNNRVQQLIVDPVLETYDFRTCVLVK